MKHEAYIPVLRLLAFLYIYAYVEINSSPLLFPGLLAFDFKVNCFFFKDKLGAGELSPDARKCELKIAFVWGYCSVARSHDVSLLGLQR